MPGYDHTREETAPTMTQHSAREETGADDRTSVPGFWRSKFVVEERYIKPGTRRALYLGSAILIVLGLIFFTIVLFGVLTHSGVTDWDKPLEGWVNSLRSPGTTVVMIVLTITFGPVVLPIIIFIVTVVWLIFAKHAWRPLILAGAMIAGVVVATVLAQIVHRHRPPTSLMLIGNDTTFSFPSGHVLGASDFLILTAFLILSRNPRLWGVTVGLGLAWAGVLAEMFSRTYLGFHWLSDTLASLSISMVIVGTVVAIDTARTARVRGEQVSGAHSQLQKDRT
jgi:membrane-associated phospholipid phosphatase